MSVCDRVGKRSKSEMKRSSSRNKKAHESVFSKTHTVNPSSIESFGLEVLVDDVFEGEWHQVGSLLYDCNTSNATIR